MIIDSKKDIQNKKWIDFKIGDIFDNVSIARSLDLLDTETDPNGINYIGRTRWNNGVTAKISPSINLVELLNKGDCITVVMVGDSTCSTFYQKTDFFASQNTLILRNKYLNQYNALFIANIINLEKYRFSYGRTLTKNFFKNHSIKLPEKNGQPDWQFMEDYIKNIKSGIKDSSPNPLIGQKMYINPDKWEYFELSKLFNLKKAKSIHAVELEDMENGKIPYITRTSFNNGTEKFIIDNNQFNENINNQNCISVGGEGLVAFYQSKNFIAGNNITLLYNKNLNKYSSMFINTLLTKQLKEKFNYGRGATKERISKLKIKLPAKNGQPDWEFMENYIKSLPYSSNL